MRGRAPPPKSIGSRSCCEAAAAAPTAAPLELAVTRFLLVEDVVMAAAAVGLVAAGASSLSFMAGGSDLLIS